jgi:hypothetical protein
MADFLEYIETIRAEEASAERLFSGDGRGVRHMRKDSPQYKQSLAEALRLVNDVLDGRQPVTRLREAMTTSDFTSLFGDILDRAVLGGYRAWTPTWPTYLKRGTVRDFRTVKRFKVDGAEAVLTKVREQTEYPESSLTDGYYSYAVEKYGRKMPFSWETFINDDLDMLKDAPDRFGKSALRTEDKFATGLFVGASGPNGTFFSSGNKNIVTSNPVLSIAGLQTAYQVLGAQVDADGEPIVVDAAVLVVPPALEVTAQNILNATEIWDVSAAGGGATGRELHVVNWMRSKVKLAVNPYIPIVASSANGNTSWFLFADPASAGRPAAEVGFLRGHEEPEVFQKLPNAQRAGGGAVDPMDGDFDTDTVEYKIRHVLGGTLMDPRAAVASSGAGS